MGIQIFYLVESKLRSRMQKEIIAFHVISMLLSSRERSLIEWSSLLDASLSTQNFCVPKFVKGHNVAL